MLGISSLSGKGRGTSQGIERTKQGGGTRVLESADKGTS
jgi:hypothetical protein